MAIKTFSDGVALPASDINSFLTNSGLVFVKSQTVGTAVSTIVVTGAFSALYDNYKVVYTNGTASTIMNMTCIMGATITGYSSSRLYNTPANGTPVGNGINAGVSWGYFGQGGNNYANFDCDIINPFAAKYTLYRGTYNIDLGQDTPLGHTQGFLANTTSYTGFTVTPAGTVTGGTVIVYGYRKP